MCVELGASSEEPFGTQRLLGTMLCHISVCTELWFGDPTWSILEHRLRRETHLDRQASSESATSVWNYLICIANSDLRFPTFRQRLLRKALFLPSG